MWTDFFTDVFKMALGVVIGTIFGMVITGLMAKRFVVNPAMDSPKVKKLQKSLDRIINDLDRALDKFEELLEIKNGKDKTLPEASDYEPSEVSNPSS